MRCCYLLLILPLFLLCCESDTPSTSPASDSHKHGHAHTPKQGGVLFAIGDHFAHLELVVDKENSKLRLFVMDGEAENYVRLSQKKITIEVLPEGQKQSRTLVLKGVESPLTGEKQGDTSEFAASINDLEGLNKFTGKIHSLKIKGQHLENIEFSYNQDHNHSHEPHHH